MSRWILAAALSVTVLPAQPSVTVASISESLPGITLIGASEPAHFPAVRALIGDSALPPYQPMLPFFRPGSEQYRAPTHRRLRHLRGDSIQGHEGWWNRDVPG
jgi:hypothetical protein